MMMKNAVLYLCLLATWALLATAAPVAPPLGDEPIYYDEQPWGMSRPHRIAFVCEVPRRLPGTDDPMRIVLTSLDEDAEYWEIGGEEPLYVVPSRAAADCDGALMYVPPASDTASECVDIATTGTGPCVTMCEPVPGSPIRLIEWDCPANTRAVGKRAFPGFTMTATGSWNDGERGLVQLRRQNDGEVDFHLVQNYTDIWVQPHQMKWAELPGWDHALLLIADLQAGLSAIPFNKTSGNVEEPLYPDQVIEGLRNLAFAEFEVDGVMHLRAYGATFTNTVAVFTVTEDSLTFLRTFETPQNETTNILACDSRHLYVFGEPGGASLWGLEDPDTEIFLDNMPAGASTGGAARRLDEGLCEVFSAPHLPEDGAVSYYIERAANQQ